MLVIAGSQPLWIEFAVPASGLALFVGIVAWGQRRPTRAGALAVLTLLLLFWLFAEGLVFRKQWPSMLRGVDSYAYQAPAWEWLLLLLLTYAGVAALAASLRFLSARRRSIGSACAVLAFTLFAIWTAIVNYAPEIGVVCAIIAALTVLADTLGTSAATDAPAVAPRSPSARVLAVIAATLLIGLWLLYALAWAALSGMGAYVCSASCWFSDPDAWQYKAEVLAALLGSVGIATLVRGWLKRKLVMTVVASTLAVCALGGWLAFYLPTVGTPFEGTVAPLIVGHATTSAETGPAW